MSAAGHGLHYSQGESRAVGAAALPLPAGRERTHTVPRRALRVPATRQVVPRPDARSTLRERMCTHQPWRSVLARKRAQQRGDGESRAQTIAYGVCLR